MLPELRKYLAAIPNLGALMDQVVLDAGVNVNNFEELKTAREAARETVFNRLRETRGLHTIIHFPELQEACVTCDQPVRGGYVEVNNAATGKAVMIPMFVWHQFLEHGVHHFVETVTNLGGSKIAERPMPIDLRGLIGVMQGSVIPPEVTAELQQAFARNG